MNARIGLRACLLLITLLALPTGIAALPRETLKAGVVKIKVAKESGKSDTGTGSVIGIHGGDTVFILTAYHVVEESKKDGGIQVSFKGTDWKQYKGKLHKFDENLDIAVVIVQTKEFPEDLPRYEYRKDGPKEQEKLTVIGHPPVQDWLVSTHLVAVANVADGDTRKFLIERGQIDRGNSGGPVFDKDGALVGTVISKSRDQATVVLIEHSRKLLASFSIPMTLLTEKGDKPTKAAAGKSEPGTGGPADSPRVRRVKDQMEENKREAESFGLQLVETNVGTLKSGKSQTVDLPMERGYVYFVTGICDDSCMNLDLFLFDSAGVKLGEDVLDDNEPTIQIEPPDDSRYRAAVKMKDCLLEPCAYGLAAFKISSAFAEKLEQLAAAETQAASGEEEYPTAGPQAWLGAPGYTYDFTATDGSVGMLFASGGSLSGAYGRVARLQAQFFFEDGSPVIGTAGVPVSSWFDFQVEFDPFDLSQISLYVPYAGFNLVPTNYVNTYRMAVQTLLLVDNVIIAQSEPTYFTVKW